MLTRRELIIKWSTYSFVSLALVFLHALLLGGVRLYGVRQFLPPLLVGVVASMEDARAGMLFGLATGLLCDLTVASPLPCLYTLGFTLAAWLCAALAKSVLQPGILCSVGVSALSFFCVDTLQMLCQLLRHRSPLLPMLALTLQELLFTLPLLAAVHPAVRFLHRKFTI